MRIELHVKARNQLGEGILWDPATQTLYWVDIPRGRVFRLADHESMPEVIAMPEDPGSLAVADDGGLLVAAGCSLYHVAHADNAITRLTGIPETEAVVDLNDGKADRSGRFVFGTKDRHEVEPTAVMYAWDAGRVRELYEPLIVFNGPAFNRAGDRIYFADSPAGRILTATYDDDSGAMGRPELFAQVPAEDGFPDGMTVDAHDHLWNAHWDGGRLTRYRSDGSVEQVIALPVERPTSLCFGGPDLKTVYVSSAALDEPGNPAPDNEIDNGDVLRLDVGIGGVPETPVTLSSP